MTDTRHCPQCGTELPADAPEGVCPQCVFQLALGSAPAAVESGAAADPASAPPNAAQQATVIGGGFVPPSADELAGLFPQLEILELLGKGGMGAVYKARQPTLDRLVAVKILPPAVAADPTFSERFTREARALARLNHPHIVTLYDFGDVQGLYYFLMEFVDGTNLRSAIESAPLNAREALAIVPQICEALQYAHDEGVVHRDIKPENILINKRGRVKIADFGLAKIVGQSTADDPASARRRDFTLTGTHQVVGTLHYIAPEQIEKPQTVDHRADIYSLGVVFYEMLTGELPIGRFAPPSQKVEMDVRLDDVVLRTLEKEPDRRYQHASDVKTEVESIERSPIPPPMPKPGPAHAVTPPSPDVNLESARRQVLGPAIGLMCAGGVNLLTLLVLVFGATVYFLVPIGMNLPTGGQRNFRGDPGRSLVIASTQIVPMRASTRRFPHVVAAAPYDRVPIRWWALLATPLGGSFFVGVLTLFGAWRMRRLESYPLAICSAVAAMLPCTPGSLVGLPCGIWALVVLSRGEIRAAFEATRRRREIA